MKNLIKKIRSFFSEIFTTWKGLAILGYMLACGYLYWIFADKELVNLIRDFTPEKAFSLFSLNLVWHIVLIVAALAILFMLIYALGTCVYSKSRININIKGAQLPESKDIPHPTLKLYVPHRRKGYIEIEFYSYGIYAQRWNDMLTRHVEPALGMHIHMLAERKGHIIAIHATTDKVKPKSGILYE